MGKYLKDFRVGDRYVCHPRTITETDVVQFAQFTGDWNPVHTDGATPTAFGGRIAHGPMFPGIAFGMLRQHDLIDGTVIALRRIAWEFLAPVRLGDTVRLTAEVTGTSRHPDRPDQGRVDLTMVFVNQQEIPVNRGTATLVIETGEGH